MVVAPTKFEFTNFIFSCFAVVICLYISDKLFVTGYVDSNKEFNSLPWIYTIYNCCHSVKVYSLFVHHYFKMVLLLHCSGCTFKYFERKCCVVHYTYLDKHLKHLSGVILWKKDSCCIKMIWIKHFHLSFKFEVMWYKTIFYFSW